MSDLDNLNCKSINKRALKGKYQLLFELIDMNLFPRSERSGTMIDPDLYLIEIVSYQKVNLPMIVIEHFNTFMFEHYDNHALPYYFCLNRVFAYFLLNVERQRKDQ